MTTRDRILDAAAHVMHTRGLARATTKEIAKAAGYSEAALYKHFPDKTGIFLAVLTERAPSNLGPLLAGLSNRVGQGTVQSTLEEVARAALDFYGQGFPMAASLFSEPRLLAAHREALRQRNAGPQHVGIALAAYLAAEQKIGRIHPDADPRAAAALLLGACLQHAFLSHFTEPDSPSNNSDGRFTGPGREDPADQFVAALVATLFRGIALTGHN
jgi:AcrR family transcriptional regulator